MEGATSFEMLITIHHSALLYILDDLHLHLHRSDNLTHRTQHLLYITEEKFAFRPKHRMHVMGMTQNYSDYCARGLVT
jgi:hypothetical protein